MLSWAGSPESLLRTRAQRRSVKVCLFAQLLLFERQQRLMKNKGVCVEKIKVLVCQPGVNSPVQGSCSFKKETVHVGEQSNIKTKIKTTLGGCKRRDKT